MSANSANAERIAHVIVEPLQENEMINKKCINCGTVCHANNSDGPIRCTAWSPKEPAPQNAGNGIEGSVPDRPALAAAAPTSPETWMKEAMEMAAQCWCDDDTALRQHVAGALREMADYDCKSAERFWWSELVEHIRRRADEIERGEK